MVNDPVAVAKTTLRSHLRRARRALSGSERQKTNAAIVERLRQVLTAPLPPALASYLALADEVDLDALHGWWWSLGHPLWLPKVDGPGQLTWHPITASDQLQSGAYGIREPDPAQIPAAQLPVSATVLVPGVGFTQTGERLGQGGGFYDRLLATHTGPTIGVAYRCQIVDAIPTGPWDRPVTRVIFPD